jgi:hypothetical protein
VADCPPGETSAYLENSCGIWLRKCWDCEVQWVWEPRVPRPPRTVEVELKNRKQSKI